MKAKVTMLDLTVSLAQFREFHRLFAIHLVLAEVPFNKVECPALR